MRNQQKDQLPRNNAKFSFLFTLESFTPRCPHQTLTMDEVKIALLVAIRLFGVTQEKL